jgi:hypothetical protein
MTITGHPSEQRRRRDACTQRAVSAAVTVARDHGLRVDEPIILNDMVSVVVHLRPAPVVARVPTWSRRLLGSVSDALQREIAITSFLAQQGAPVVPVSPELPPGPHDHDEFVIGFWTYVEPDPDRAVTNDDCLSTLPDLHEALQTYPGVLPGLDPGVIDIQRWWAALDDSDHHLAAEDIEILRGAAERLRPFLESPPDTTQALHGDVHDENLIATCGDLLWIDFENACRGPVEWDLLMVSDAEAIHTIPHDPIRLARCREVKALQVALGLSAMADIFSDNDILNGSIQRQIGILRAAT